MARSQNSRAVRPGRTGSTVRKSARPAPPESTTKRPAKLHHTDCGTGKYNEEGGARRRPPAETAPPASTIPKKGEDTGGLSGLRHREIQRPGGSSSETACSNCTVGSYNDEKDAARCKSCPRGFSQPKITSYFCLPCVFGQLQPLVGQGSCTNCLAGYFARGPK